MPKIKWDRITKSENDIILHIARRAVSNFMGGKFSKDDRVLQDFIMDISATHLSTPLRLKDLLYADDFNFCHDVFGIRQNLNRTTGKLERFVPRFTKKDT